MEGVWILLGAALSIITTYISQQRAFDHRFRLEKEYELCAELWEKLFELRRSIAQLAWPEHGPDIVAYSDEQIVAAFNAFQGVVRKSEPLLCETVYKPARKILELAGEIKSTTEERHLAEQQRGSISMEKNDQLAAKQIEIYEEKEATFKQINELYQEVCDAIRKRVRPKRIKEVAGEAMRVAARNRT